MLPSPSQRLLVAALHFFFASLAMSTAATQTPGSTPAEPRYAVAADGQTRENPLVGQFQRALARVQPYIERYGYGAVAAAVLVEGIGIPMPGQTLLIGGAVEALEGRMSLAMLLVLVTVSAVLGNTIGYGIGRWAGGTVLTKLKVSAHRQQHLENLFKRYGGLLVLLGRFVDGLRQFNGIVCGMMKMPWVLFTAYNIAGALLWTCAWGLGTYYLGRRIHYFAAFIHHHRAFLYLLTGTLVLALFCYLLRRRTLS